MKIRTGWWIAAILVLLPGAHAAALSCAYSVTLLDNADLVVAATVVERPGRQDMVLDVSRYYRGTGPARIWIRLEGIGNDGLMYLEDINPPVGTQALFGIHLDAGIPKMGPCSLEVPLNSTDAGRFFEYLEKFPRGAMESVVELALRADADARRSGNSVLLDFRYDQIAVRLEDMLPLFLEANRSLLSFRDATFGGDASRELLPWLQAGSYGLRMLEEATRMDEYWRLYQDILRQAGVAQPTAAQIQLLHARIAHYAVDSTLSNSDAYYQSFLANLPHNRLPGGLVATELGGGIGEANALPFSTEQALSFAVQYAPILAHPLRDGQLTVEKVDRATLPHVDLASAVDMADLVQRAAADPTLLVLTPGLAIDAGFGQGFYVDYGNPAVDAVGLTDAQRLQGLFAPLSNWQAFLHQASAGYGRIDNSFAVARFAGILYAMSRP